MTIPMVAYIPTRATPRLRAHHLAKELDLDYRLVCDDNLQARHLQHEYKIPTKNIIIAEGAPGPPYGAAYKRDFICTEVAPVDEWLIWLDDNVSHLTCLDPELSSSKLNFNNKDIDWRKEFANVATPEQVWHYVEETMQNAELLGTINCGFSTDDNFYFRARKWQFYGYCRSQFTMYKNDGSSWMPIKRMMFEDMYKTVDVVARYGCVVINRHIKPIKPMFEAGGIGTLEERKPALIHNCQWLMSEYPGLLTYSKGREYHVTFAKRSQKTVDQWRREHGYL